MVCEEGGSDAVSVLLRHVRSSFHLLAKLRLTILGWQIGVGRRILAHYGVWHHSYEWTGEVSWMEVDLCTNSKNWRRA